MGSTLPAIERCLIVRPYLVSARNHGRRPLDAIPDALNGTAWRPPRKTATALAA